MYSYRQCFVRNLSNLMSRNICANATVSSRSHILRNDVKELFHSAVRNYSANNNPKIDPNQKARRKGLMILTYTSGFLGACLLTAVGAREYQRLKYRARGIEPLKIRHFGRKPFLFHYRGYNLNEFVVDVVDDIHPFQVREDDVWIVTYPKAGTTWMQEIVYLIQSGLDFEAAKTITVEERIPYFEYMYPGLKTIDKMPSPRCLKSHLPLSLLPNEITVKKPKIIYLARNPKDTVVSFYFFVTKFFGGGRFTGTFEDFCQLFTIDQASYGPWWKHVKEAWNQREEDNILFITYEDMIKDLPGAVRKVAEFLGKPLSSQEVEKIVFHCSFDEMKKNNSVNYSWFKVAGVAKTEGDFMRKGKVGDWKNHLSQATVNKLDEMVATKLEPSGLVFTDSLDKDSD